MIDSESSSQQIVPRAIAESLDWLIRVEEFQTVKKLVESLVKFGPIQNPEFTDFIAHTLHKSKNYREAAEFALLTVSLLPNNPGTYFNAAKCLHSAARPQEAEKLIIRALQLKPDWVDAQIERSVYICAQGRFDEGLKILENLLQVVPATEKNADVIRFNLGWHKIRTGDFKTGIDWLGIGRKLRIWGAYSRPFQKPVVQKGMSLQGKSILLSGEGGAGDELINVRFAQTLKERGAKEVIWVCQHPLLSLIERNPWVDKVVGLAEAATLSYDYWIPAMDLPRILDLDKNEIPNEPYLFPHQDSVEKWSHRIPRNGKLRVGLRWQGNPLYEQDLLRSVPFQELLPLFDVEGVEFYSLQRDSGVDEIVPGTKIVDLSQELVSWEDTAGAIANLDLVISSCTSVPHLAAAMGKKVWLFTPINHYYLWATPGSSSPWYKTIHLFRQSEFGTWKAQIQEIKEKLAAEAQGVIS